MKIEKFFHHRDTWGFQELRGKHREVCLCWSCKKFRPEHSDNCFIAESVFNLNKTHGITTPVLECSVFERKE